jgi:hypothetical protein
MLQASGRTARPPSRPQSGQALVTGSALVRLLARFASGEVPASGQAFADRLSQWVGWTDAISLSAALEGGAQASADSRISRDAESADDLQCQRTRTAWADAIAAAIDPSTDFAPYRQRYLSRQQAMESGIESMRARLRARLAAGSPAMARLAAVDVVMEQVLAPHEQRLLATVPGLLHKHFERLRLTEVPEQPRAWLDSFGRDMQAVLLAELDIRFQPIEGLLDALRKR